jgi:recombination protein RecR
MRLLPNSLQALVMELARLPGVGERTALRYAVALLKAGPKRMESLQTALGRASTEIAHCSVCHFWTQDGQCPLCTDTNRSDKRLCIVRDAPDVLALEKSRTHSWKYHVLQGLLSPLGGIGPGQIRLESLFRRLESEGITELIIAVDATVEGDATALFIRDHIRQKHAGIGLTRTALGLPAGSSVEFLDSSTLENALQHRTNFE